MNRLRAVCSPLPMVSAALALCGVALGVRVGAERQEPPRAPAQARPGATAPRLTVPPGFTAREVYPAERAGSIVAITFDSAGDLVIGREGGPVVRVRDTDGDGVFDAEQVVTDAITNCQGLLFAGADLLAVCDGPEKPTTASLYRVPDRDGDGRGEAPALITKTTYAIGEHGAHTLVVGPDGDVYWMVGNFAGLESSFAPLSPYENFGEEQLLPVMSDPRAHGNQVRAPAGFIARLRLADTGTRPAGDPHPATAGWEIVAGGFRNAYDAAFNLSGELFTFDSDMEWDINLPWYRPVRTLHLVPGGDYGFRYGSGPLPSSYPDTLPPLSELGRGSPVGLVFYQGEAFPAEYRDALLLGDWSRGRILVARHQPAGASYTETVGDFVLGTPLNVTDVDVGADGAVYFALGGRKTRGGIFRVAHEGAARARPAPPADPVARALAQPQPRSAWGRAAIEDARRAAGASWGASLQAVIEGTGAPAQRARALELLQVHGDPLAVASLARLAQDGSAEVRAGAALLLGLHQSAEARRALAPLLRDEQPVVQRRAAEALVRTGLHPAMAPPFDAVADVLPLLGHQDRHVRYAARQLLRRVNRNHWRTAALALGTMPAAIEAHVLLAQTARVPTDVPPLLDRQIELLESGVTDEALVGVLRAMHLALIRAEGVRHTARYAAVGAALLGRFPTGQPLLDREIARTLAFLDTAGALPKLVAYMTAPATHRDDQIFMMYCLRAMQTEWEKPERDLVVRWFLTSQEQRWRGGASFIGYMKAFWEHFLEVLPSDERQAAEDVMPSFQPNIILTSSGRPAPPGEDTARLSQQELHEYMTLDPMAYAGDPARGERVFEKALCSACHRSGTLGQEAGPDLTNVAQRFGRTDLLDAILTPSKAISDQWASVEIVTKAKRVVTGVIVSDEADVLTVQPIGSAPVRIPVSEIESRKTATVSPMPEGLLNALTLKEIADLFAFLEQPSSP